MKKLIILNVIITATISLGVNLILMYVSSPPRIMTADFEVVKGAIVESAIKGISNGEPVNSKEKVDKFQRALADISKRKNVVIIDKRAVIGGSKDISNDLKQLVEDM